MESTNGTSVKRRLTKQEVKRQREERRMRTRLEQMRQRANHDRTLIEFQPDAVEIERRSVPGGARWTLYAVMGLLCATVAWAYWAQVDKIVVTNGKLVTVDPPVVVQAASAAPIRTMHFKFGDHVKSGDLLATLDPTFTEADLAALRGKLKYLTANIARLSSERDGQEFAVDGHQNDLDWLNQYQLWLERRNEYRARINEFESRKNKLLVQQENNLENIKMLTKNVEDYKQVQQKYKRLADRGSASPIEILGAELQTRQTEGELMTAKNLGREYIADLDALDKERRAFEAKWRADTARELLEAQRQFDAAQQELAKAVRMNELVEIRVPEDQGYQEFEVLEVADRGLGSVLQAGEALYKLIPLNASLEAEVEVEGKDVALLQEGTVVKVKLNAFPFQRHGTLSGAVRIISEDAFEKQLPNGTTTVNYRARVALDEPIQLDKVGDNFRLTPGMSTVAEMKVGRRRVIHYFLYPLIRAWDTSIREP